MARPVKPRNPTCQLCHLEPAIWGITLEHATTTTPTCAPCLEQHLGLQDATHRNPRTRYTRARTHKARTTIRPYYSAP